MAGKTIPSERPRARFFFRHSTFLWLLSFAFALRVLGQAIQYWRPQPLLPPFTSFQGSNLSYAFLLPAQLAILGTMVVVSRRVARGQLTPSLRASHILRRVGGIYLVASLARIAVGIGANNAADWFRSWIPATFHLVLAVFILALACSHRFRCAKGS